MIQIGPDLTRIDTTPQFARGTTWHDGTNKWYKYCVYDTGGGVVAVVNDMCYYYGPGGAHGLNYDNAQVTRDLSASTEIGAGMLLSVPGDGEFHWIQITGPAQINTITAGSDGDKLTPTGSTDGGLDLSAATTDKICAIATDISADRIILDCPF